MDFQLQILESTADPPLLQKNKNQANTLALLKFLLATLIENLLNFANVSYLIPKKLSASIIDTNTKKISLNIDSVQSCIIYLVANTDIWCYSQPVKSSWYYVDLLQIFIDSIESESALNLDELKVSEERSLSDAQKIQRVELAFYSEANDLNAQRWGFGSTFSKKSLMLQREIAIDSI